MVPLLSDTKYRRPRAIMTSFLGKYKITNELNICFLSNDSIDLKWHSSLDQVSSLYFHFNMEVPA